MPLQQPNAFISYSWDDEKHKAWTRSLALRLRSDGVDVKLDQWDVAFGDQLPKFMETAIRENNYVLIVCTPNYKRKSDERKGGVGYEGDIMTAEVLSDGNQRKFIPLVRSRPVDASVPSWLKGKYYVDLSGDPYQEDCYQDLVATLHNQREKAPALGAPPVPGTIAQHTSRGGAGSPNLTNSEPAVHPEPIKIEGVLADEVGNPRNDGTPGSALYTVPIKLNRAPTHEWCELFRGAWNHPPQSSFMHRPGIASVQGDRIILEGTTIEEVRDVHRATLKLAVDVANREVSDLFRKRSAAEDAARLKNQEHRDRVRRASDGLSFD